MSKAASGPRLELYGPDTKHGASRKSWSKNYTWYIVWHEGDRKYERSTGAGLREKAEAENALERLLAERRDAAKPARGYYPHQVTVGQILRWYVDEKAPQTAVEERICHAVDAMYPFWSDVLLSEVGKKICDDYVKWRSKQPSKNFRTALEAWERRKDYRYARQFKTDRKPVVGEKPQFRGISLRTIRTEMEYLQAAITYCREALYITERVSVCLPEKGDPRSEWLTRTEFARLLLAAREKIPGRPDARRHLILYLLVGVYQPARRQAILQLPLVQPIDGAWIDVKNGHINFGRGRGNKKRPQHVPIHPRLLPYIRAAAARGQRYLVEYRENRSNEGTGSAKPPLNNIRRSFSGAVKRAGIERRITPHTLRHTGVTWLKDADVDTWKVAGFAGMTPETVERIYAHHHPDNMQGTIDALTKKRRK